MTDLAPLLIQTVAIAVAWAIGFVLGSLGRDARAGRWWL